MNRNQILGAVLAVQVLAAVLYLFSGNRLQSHAGISKFVEFDTSQVNRVVITDGNGSLAELKRDGETWMTADEFPVTHDRINNLLRDIAELDHGLAVATTTEAEKRFKVHDDNFERHVKLFDDKKLLGEFFIGSGAGARKNHIRMAGESSIYVADLASYSVPAEIGDWQDKEQLQIEEDTIHSIQFDGMMIQRAPQSPETGTEGDTTVGEADDTPGWTTEGLAEGETLDIDTIEEQIGNLAGIRYDLAFRGTLEASTNAADSPAREITVFYGDESRTYQFYKSAQGDGFILKVSDQEELFEISRYNGNRIIENLSADTVIQKPETEEEPQTEESTGGNTTTNETENSMPWMPGN